VPLDDRDEAALFFKILNVDPPPVSTHAPDLPPGVDAVAARALAKDPARRYQTVGELMGALERLREEIMTGERRTVEVRSRFAKKRWVLGAAGAAVLLLALAVILLRVLGWL
ncbi:MAG: hypothetical protein P8181_06285, partial [bacterium]